MRNRNSVPSAHAFAQLMATALVILFCALLPQSVAPAIAADASLVVARLPRSYTGTFQWEDAKAVASVSIGLREVRAIDAVTVEALGRAEYPSGTVDLRMKISADTLSVAIWESDPEKRENFVTDGSHRGSLSEDLRTIQAEWKTAGGGRKGNLFLRASQARPNFTTYPNVAFAAGEPGRIGLYVEGEDWHVVMSLPGFRHVDDMPFSGPSQFFLMERSLGTGENATRMTASAFASRLDGADGTNACLTQYAPSIQRARDGMAQALDEIADVSDVSGGEIRGHRFLAFEIIRKDPSFNLLGPSGRRKAIHWFPYYGGHCFHFHIDFPGGTAAENEISKAFDSITYVPQVPAGVMVDRLFYLDRLRIRLSVPIEWRYSHHPPPPGPVGGIELEPPLGRAFRFLVIPLGVPRGADGSIDPAKTQAEGIRNKYLEEGLPVSPLRELCAAESCTYYYDISLRPDRKPDPRGFSAWRQGYRKIGNMVYGISAFYSDASAHEVDTLVSAVSQAAVLDLVKAQQTPADF